MLSASDSFPLLPPLVLPLLLALPFSLPKIAETLDVALRFLFLFALSLEGGPGPATSWWRVAGGLVGHADVLTCLSAVLFHREFVVASCQAASDPAVENGKEKCEWRWVETRCRHGRSPPLHVPAGSATAGRLQPPLGWRYESPHAIRAISGLLAHKALCQLRPLHSKTYGLGLPKHRRKH